MVAHVGHLARLVDDLLDVSRITPGKIDLHDEAVELAGVVNRAVETAQPHIDAKGHSLTISLPPFAGRPVCHKRNGKAILRSLARWLSVEAAGIAPAPRIPQPCSLHDSCAESGCQ